MTEYAYFSMKIAYRRYESYHRFSTTALHHRHNLC